MRFVSLIKKHFMHAKAILKYLNLILNYNIKNNTKIPSWRENFPNLSFFRKKLI